MPSNIVPRALLVMLLAATGCRSTEEAGDLPNGAFVPHVAAEDGPVPRSWKVGGRFTPKSAPRHPVTPDRHQVSATKRHHVLPSGMLTSLARQVAGDEERRWWKRRRQRTRRRTQRAAEIPSVGVSQQAIVTPDLAPVGSPLIAEAPGSPLSPSSSSSTEIYGSASEALTPTSTETVVTPIDHDGGDSCVDELAPTESSGTSTTSEASTTTTTPITPTTPTTPTTAAAATEATATATATATSTTQTASSTVLTGANSDEYFADDHSAGDNVPTPDPAADESDKSSVRLSNETSTEKAMNETTSRAPMASEFASRASAAVGRVLSQEENVPWPEAKSTKVIGTIIQDVHGPYQQSDRQDSIAAATLTGSAIATIVICTFLIVVTTAGASGYWWYRRRYLNRPETLNDRYAPSETGANGDDIFRVGYVHSPEMPRDSSEEMYSLDNDSFLTSLEAMTIPTYWTETIKHTKL